MALSTGQGLVVEATVFYFVGKRARNQSGDTFSRDYSRTDVFVNGATQSANDEKPIGSEIKVDPSEWNADISLDPTSGRREKK